MRVLGKCFGLWSLFGNYLPPDSILEPASNKTCLAKSLFEIAVGPTSCVSSAWTSGVVCVRERYVYTYIHFYAYIYIHIANALSTTLSLRVERRMPRRTVVC